MRRRSASHIDNAEVGQVEIGLWHRILEEDILRLTSTLRDAMRIEATLPDSRGAAVIKLAEELGLTRSQFVDEAVALFMRAIMEVRRGRRLVTVDSVGSQAACEIATPTLTTLEWAANPIPVRLSPVEFDRLVELTSHAPEPTESLRKSADEHERRLASRAAVERERSSQ
jgi:hypothetical protein